MTINNEVKDRVCGFKNQYRALKKCCNGVMWKDSVARHSNNALLSTLKIVRGTRNGTYKVSQENAYNLRAQEKNSCEHEVHRPSFST